MSHIALETDIEVGGKRYRLPRLSREIGEKFVAWVNPLLPHPLDAIKGHLDGLPEAMQQRIVDDALERAYSKRTIESPEVDDYMHTAEGLSKLLTLLLQEYQPELTQRDVDTILEDSIMEHGPRYLADKLSIINGVIPVEADQEDQGEQPAKKNASPRKTGRR